MRIQGGHNTSPFHLGKIVSILFVVGLLLLSVLFLINKSDKVVNKTSDSVKAEQVVQPFQGNKFEIDIKQDAYEKLAAKRDAALKIGLLYSSKDDLVDANLKIDGKPFACKLRLKGDLMDHLQGDRWSFRIILKDNKEWRGMNTFNIHNSKSRSHTAEWVMHKLFEDEGIMFPEYDFIKVKLNGKELGVYAYEHHFENQLVKKNGRELGPILKHSDDAYWENVHKKLEPFPWIQASSIELFNKENSKDPEFRKAFDQAHGLLNAFLEEKKTAAEVFDLAIMAKYYALLDLTHAWHAQLFTNIRFYLNPMSGKLEPIAYDCFGDHLSNVTPGWEAFGQGMNSRSSKKKSYDNSNVYRWLLFQDMDFFKFYMQYLERYTEPAHLNRIIAKHGSERDGRVAYVKSDKQYKDIAPSWDGLFLKSTYTYKKIQPKPHLSLKARRVNNSKQEIDLQSFHYFPMEVIGFGDEAKLIDTLSEPYLMEAYNNHVPVRTYRYKHHRDIQFIYYRTLGLNEIHKASLLKVSSPPEVSQLARDKIRDYSSLPFVSEIGRDLIITEGKHEIREALIIPVDKRLVISAGAELFFAQRGKLLSYGPVSALGTKAHPIKFISENAGGIFISGSDEQSKFSNCFFNGLSQFSEGNIATHAAVTFYKTKAELDNCYFDNIAAKSALLCNYSQVEVKNSYFNNCQGTGLESKYSSVKLTVVNMNQIGSNGMSISSGSVNAVNLKMKSVLNHAMHFTDNTNAYVHTVAVSDSYQSLFANKHSQVKIVNFNNYEVSRGVEVRTVESPATLVEINNLQTTKVEQLYLFKEGISITVDGKKQTAE